jgi:hypothetical protein
MKIRTYLVKQWLMAMLASVDGMRFRQRNTRASYQGVEELRLAP